MKDAQKPDHVSLNTLIGYLRDGRYVIPRLSERIRVEALGHSGLGSFNFLGLLYRQLAFVEG